MRVRSAQMTWFRLEISLHVFTNKQNMSNSRFSLVLRRSGPWGNHMTLVGQSRDTKRASFPTQQATKLYIRVTCVIPPGNVRYLTQPSHVLVFLSYVMCFKLNRTKFTINLFFKGIVSGRFPKT